MAGIVTGEDAVKSWTTRTWATFGTLTCGTPDDVAARIEHMLEQSGGFGTFLILAHNAASWTATQNSFALFARHVMPRFQNRDRRVESLAWVEANNETLMASLGRGIARSLDTHRDRLG